MTRSLISTGGALSKLSIMSISISSESISITFISSAGPALLPGIAACLASLLLFSVSVSGFLVNPVLTIFALRLSYLSVSHFFPHSAYQAPNASYTYIVEIVCVCVLCLTATNVSGVNNSAFMVIGPHVKICKRLIGLWFLLVLLEVGSW